MINRIAIIGCGRHTQNTLAKFINNLENVEVSALVDIDINRAMRIKNLIRQGKCFTRLEDIDVEYDGAIVALPPEPAYEAIEKLINIYKPVFAEKPPAHSTDMIENLQKLAKKNNVLVQIGFNYRFSEALMVLKNEISNIKAKKSLAEIEFKSKYPKGPEWGVQNPIEAWLRHNGIHALDLALWLNGNYSSVKSYIISKNKNEFLLSITLLHLNNSITVLNLGNITHSFLIKTNINGIDGTSYFLPDLGHLEKTSVNTNLHSTIIFKSKNLDNCWRRAGYGPELEHFINNSKHNAPVASLKDALNSSILCDEILKQII